MCVYIVDENGEEKQSLYDTILDMIIASVTHL